MTLIEVLALVGGFCALLSVGIAALSLGVVTWRAITNHIYGRFDAQDARFDTQDTKLDSIVEILRSLTLRVGRLEGGDE